MDERELIKRLMTGEEKAQTELYDYMEPRLRPIPIIHLGFNHPECDDVIQDTFVVAYTKIGEFDPNRSGLYTWMAKICIYKCWDINRRNGRWVLQQEEDLEFFSSKTQDFSGQQTDEERLRAERLALIHEKIGLLSPQCREIVQLRDLEGKSYIEIAFEIKRPKGTVMSRLGRCRETLRNMVMGGKAVENE